MTALHLPVDHTDHDLELAGAIARSLRSRELFVAWSTDGGTASPVIDAVLRGEPRIPLRRPSLFSRLLEHWRGL